MQWQREQVLALAPDSASLKAAQGLTIPNKWLTLGHDGAALWGECQGSGKTPYQTAIDLRTPAFNCSCPSRKFPCKHGLALFLLYLQAGECFVQQPALPAWVQSWLAERTKRQEAQAQKASMATAASSDAAPIVPATAQADANAIERRATARAEKVAGGIAELTIWLHDLVRNGFVEAQARPYADWQQMAARLIDAQAPGLAAQVQALGSIIASGADWAERLTAAVGRLFLLIEAYQRLAHLPAALQQDIRTLIGWHQSKEEVLAGRSVSGEWSVLSQTLEQEEQLISQRIWLQEQTRGDYALILNFAHPSNRQMLEPFWRVGTTVAATLYYYDSAVPLRALATDVTVCGPMFPLRRAAAVADALHRYQAALVHHPWVTRYPLCLANSVVGLEPAGERVHFFVYDQERHLLPITPKAKSNWQVLSITGGHPADIFGEWLDDGLLPLGVWHEGRYWAL